MMAGQVIKSPMRVLVLLMNLICIPANMLPLLIPIFWSMWSGHLHTICVQLAWAPLLTSVISRLQMEHSVKRVWCYVLIQSHNIRDHTQMMFTLGGGQGYPERRGNKRGCVNSVFYCTGLSKRKVA